ncbi:hypothetical protein CRENBAI_008684 [Crenichthys baileyi]|uniref:Uncharacterized protein n=1 Tax=Crenichthys baileyi TaxID=28760 RepID=A0AAV9RS03_9TELE
MAASLHLGPPFFQVLTECFRNHGPPDKPRRQTPWIAGFSSRWGRYEEFFPHRPEVCPLPSCWEQREREAVQLRSPPAPWAAHSGPAVKPSPSSHCKKRRRGAPSCGSAGEEVVETTVRQFHCPPSPTPSHMSGAAAQSTSCLQNGATATAEQPMPDLQGAAAEQPTPGLQSAAAEQPTPGLQSAAAEQPTPGLQSAAAEQPTPGPQPDKPQPDTKPDLKSASTSSTHCRGRRKRGASAQVTEGLGTPRLFLRHEDTASSPLLNPMRALRCPSLADVTRARDASASATSLRAATPPLR